MTKAWADPDHVGKITVSIMNILSKHFHKEAKKSEEDQDFDKLIKLSQACGYQAQLYSGLQKSHEFARRLDRIDKVLETATPETLALGLNPVVIEENEMRSKKLGV